MKLRRKRKDRPRPELTERESDLCDAFAEAATGDGWIVYPEVEGWDLLLVWKGGIAGAMNYVEDGDQIGVQAKLRANVSVLRQALSGRSLPTGPKFRTVLVPRASRDFQDVAAILGLGVYTERNIRDVPNPKPYWPDRIDRRVPVRASSRTWSPSFPLWLPPIVPNRSGGVPAPSGLTRWRIAAIQLCMILEDRGHVTRDDFRKVGIDKTRWVDRWIIRQGSIGRLARYVAKPGTELPIEGWRDEAPRLVTPEIAAILDQAAE